MRLTVLGCSGSFAGPASPASGYLVQADDADGRRWNIVMELGSGAFGALQRHLDPTEVDAVVLSHLHPDHCADIAGLYVYLKYNPYRPAPKINLYGPAGIATLRETLHPAGGSYYGRETQFELCPWVERETISIGPLAITPYRVNHPLPTMGMRIVGPADREQPTEGAPCSASGANAEQGADDTPPKSVLAFTGDSDECSALEELAEGADLLLSEAAFIEGRDRTRGVHLTGRRAGLLAERAKVGRLLLTHVPPWNDPSVTFTEAAEVYSGPISMAAGGQVVWI